MTARKYELAARNLTERHEGCLVVPENLAWITKQGDIFSFSAKVRTPLLFAPVAIPHAPTYVGMFAVRFWAVSFGPESGTRWVGARCAMSDPHG